MQLFHPNGTFALAFGSAGSAHGQLDDPGSAAWSPDGSMIAVADTGNDRVQLFHPNGTFALAFGGPGEGDGH